MLVCRTLQAWKPKVKYIKKKFWFSLSTESHRKWDGNMSKKGEDVHIIISEIISLDVSHRL